MTNTKSILFFFVHPSKYHLFKHTINYLKNEGYNVEIAIVTKDILEDLIKNEGWNYINIIPEGRRNKKLNPYVSILYNTLKTLYNLWRITKGKKYDLFVSDDLLPVIGRLKNVISLHIQDDDLTAVPETKYIMRFANYIFSPECSNLGNFNSKKIAYKGNHEIAYLHPKYFKPNTDCVKQFNNNLDKYFVLRLVSLTATHDIKKKGINDEQARYLINLLKNYGKVYITSERELIPEFEQYRIKINPNDIAHALYYAEMFIGDSQTMTSEAAVLGTPAIRFNDFVGRLSYLDELEHKYHLTYGFKTNEFDKMIEKVKELLETDDLKMIFYKRREVLLNDYIDVTEFLINTIKRLTSQRKR